jgi:hypothetical protein
MMDWIDKLARRMRGGPRKEPRLPGPPRQKPPRRGKGGGSATAPVDPKPRPTLLTGGAEVPLDEA